MAAIDLHRVELHPLKAGPEFVHAFLVVPQRQLLQHAAACTDLRVVAYLAWSDGDCRVRDHIFLVRPQPAHAELILNETVNCVGVPILLLHVRLHREPPLCLHVVRIPAVATGDDEMILVGEDERFLGMLEIEVRLGKQRFHSR